MKIRKYILLSNINTLAFHSIFFAEICMGNKKVNRIKISTKITETNMHARNGRIKWIGKNILSNTNTHTDNSLVFWLICMGNAKGDLSYNILSMKIGGKIDLQWMQTPIMKITKLLWGWKFMNQKSLDKY